MERNMGDRQRWVWLIGGLSAVIAACGCGLGWLWLLIGGSLACLYYVNMEYHIPDRGLAFCLPKVVAAVLLLWTIAVMAWAGNLADRAFPSVEGFPTLGWTMLAMAAWGSKKGPGACAGCAGVLCIFLLVLYGMITVFALPDVEPEYLKPVGSWDRGVTAAGLFLIPGGIWYLPCRRRGKSRAWGVLIIAAGAALVAGVTAGVLSPLLVSSQATPFYILAQSVSLFGVVERIEPLLSTAMTMGVFCLLTIMACTCKTLSDRVYPVKWSGIAACVLSAVWMGPAGRLPTGILVAGCLVCYGLIPLIALWIVNKKGL